MESARFRGIMLEGGKVLLNVM